MTKHDERANRSERKPRRRWLRRLVVSAVVIAIASRLVLWLALPTMLQSLAATHGLRLQVEDIDLSLLTGRVDLWYLRLDPETPTAVDPTDQDSGPPEPWLDVEYFTFDVDVSALIAGTFRIRRAEIDGLEARLFRDSGGDWNWARFLPKDSESTEDEEREPKRPFTFTSPVEINALRLQHVHIHVSDPKNVHPFEKTLDLTVRLSDLGSGTRPTRLEFDANMEGVLDSLQISASMRGDGTHLDAAVELDVVAYHPRALAPYLDMPSMRPVAEEVAATLSFDLALEAMEQGEAFSIHAKVKESSVRADVEDELRIGELTLVAPHVSRAGASGVTATIDGLYARAGLMESGWRALGFEWGTDTAAPADRGAPDAEPFVFELTKLRVQDATLDFMDATRRPAVDLNARISYLEGGPLVVGAGTAPPPLRLSTSIAAPGVADEILLSGEIDWAADQSRWKAKLNARGATLEAIRPYLIAVSVDPTLQDGTLALDANLVIRSDVPGRTSLEVDLFDLLIADEGQVLAAGEGFMHGFQSDGETSTLTLGDIDLRRVQGRVLRREDGSWDWPGFRVPESQGTHAAGAAGNEEPPDDGGDTRIMIPSVRLRGQELVFTDRTISPAITLQVAKIDGTLTDLSWGGAPDGAAMSNPASLDLSLQADGICDDLSLRASLAAREGAFDVDIDAAIRAVGIRDDVLSVFLGRSGIESEIDLAALSLDVRAHARQENDAFVLDATAKGSLDNAGARVFAFERAEVKEFRFGAGPPTAASFEVDDPFASIERDDQGAVFMGGLRFPPIAHGPAAAARAASSAERARGFRGSIDELIVRRSRVAWKDLAVTPAVDTTLTLSGAARGLRMGSPARPMSFRIDAGATGIAEQLLVEGSLSPDWSDMTADATIQVSGARIAPVAGYLPDTSQVTVQEGHLLAHMSARVTSLEQGGHRVEMELDELDFRDGRESDPWMTLDSFRMEAPRIDLDAGVYEIGGISSRGLRMRAARDERGVVAMGMRWNARSPDPEPDLSDSEKPDVPAPLETAPAAHPAPPATYPTVTLGPVDLGVDEFRYEDRTTPDHTTTVGRLRITTPGVQRVFDADPAELDPMRLSIAAGFEPFLKDLVADVRIAPFAVDPNFKMDLSISGIQGAEWVRAVPEWKGKIDAAGWKDAAIAAHFELDIDPRNPRRTPFQIDPSGTFSAGLLVSDVTLRATPDADPIAGLDSLSIQASRVSPTTGDVTVRTVEVSHPYASVTVEDERILVAGLALRRDAVETEEVLAAEATTVLTTEPPAYPPAPATTNVVDAGHAEPPPNGLAGAPAAGGELRVDALRIEDISLDFRDVTVDPPLVLPFTDIDVQARQLSSNMFKEPRPIRFRVQASAGDIELKKRTGGTNVLFDVLSGARKVAKGMIGMEKKVTLVKRPAFDSIDFAGRMTFFPAWDGYIRGGVRALELPNFAGLAAGAGVTVSDGLVDYQTDVRFDGGRTTVNSHTTLSYLGLTEPPNGPISRVLKLTAPLPVVLAVLRDRSGDIRIPTRLTFGPNGLSTGAYLGAITKTLSGLIADAVASSPFRVAGTITDVVELLPIPMPEEVTGPPFDVNFTPASTTITQDVAEEIRSIGREIADDSDLLIEVQHSLGNAGIARIGELANPPRELCLQLAAVLRQNKADLQAARRALAAQARAEYGIGRGAEASDIVQQLRDLDGQLMTTDSALGEALALLQPGAERKEDQRTRAACLEVARRRLSMISQLLTETAGQDAMSRVRIRQPRFVLDPESESSHVTITRRRARP